VGLIIDFHLVKGKGNASGVLNFHRVSDSVSDLLRDLVSTEEEYLLDVILPKLLSVMQLLTDTGSSRWR